LATAFVLYKKPIAPRLGFQSSVALSPSRI
jgi:hypothetical protein